MRMMLPLVLLLSILPHARAATAPTPFRILNWGSYIDLALVKRFEQQQNVKVTIDIAGGSIDMYAAMKKDPTKYDIVVPGSEFVKIMTIEKLIQPLDRKIIVNANNLLSDFMDRQFDPGNIYSVPYLWGTVGIFYDSRKIKTPVDSWSIFFDPNINKDKFLLMSSPRETLGAAMKYLGESLNTQDSNVLKKAFNLIQKTQTNPRYRGLAQDVQLTARVISGEAALSMAYSGDGIQGMAQNPNMRFVLPKEGSLLFMDTLVIPSKAPHVKLANTFINFMLDAKNSAQNSSVLGYPTPNRAAKELLEPAIRNNPNIYPNGDALNKFEFALAIGKLNDAYIGYWKQVENTKPKP
jgi:spermidine/putrescine transport system substrate-binding protein